MTDPGTSAKCSPSDCARSAHSPSPTPAAPTRLSYSPPPSGPSEARASWRSPPVSESLALGELASARALADDLGARHLTVRTQELSRPGYRANGRDRCYFCKSEVLDALALAAREYGYEWLATGTNADDAADPHRPGISAGRERGVYTPLLDTGLTKDDVRAISKL
jgi:hypothetical protein